MSRRVWTPERLEDAQFMLDHDEHPERVAMRLDVTLPALESAMRKAGRPDLVAMVGSVVHATKTPEERARDIEAGRRFRARKKVST